MRFVTVTTHLLVICRKTHSHLRVADPAVAHSKEVVVRAVERKCPLPRQLERSSCQCSAANSCFRLAAVIEELLEIFDAVLRNVQDWLKNVQLTLYIKV